MWPPAVSEAPLFPSGVIAAAPNGIAIKQAGGGAVGPGRIARSVEFQKGSLFGAATSCLDSALAREMS